MVKTAILRRYNINEETYRQRFRAVKPKEEESPQELMTRLQDLASWWTRETATHQELLDLLVREQFLSVLPPDMKVAVMERQPSNCNEASQFAENYLQARATTMGGPEQVQMRSSNPRGPSGRWSRSRTAVLLIRNVQDVATMGIGRAAALNATGRIVSLQEQEDNNSCQKPGASRGATDATRGGI